jgi:hypothetical protein
MHPLIFRGRGGGRGRKSFSCTACILATPAGVPPTSAPESWHTRAGGVGFEGKLIVRTAGQERGGVEPPTD